ncbi:unnamed protein product [Effrenium voratum]|uniref:Methyltransferase small domain-containing protein n=1 Tax=Effrenium voratum TaxID=2562239 RepID=A0AA36I549_9DINO|nr:unnamed protein product [Effrenium voratum]
MSGAMELSGLPKHPVRNPKLEQYATDGDIAARWLMGIDAQDPFEELDEVCDLGAGNGILGLGALLLGAPRCVFLEVDALACAALEDGLADQGLQARARVLQRDVAQADAVGRCALVISNPPWGQQRRSADRPFLEASISIAQQAVHLMHSSGAAHIEPWAEDMGWDAQRWRRAQLGRHERCGGLLWSPFGLI